MIFLKKCIFCNRIIENENKILICADCYSELEFLPIKIYKRKDVLVEGLICVLKYNALLKKAIVNFKYFNKPNAYKGFGSLMSKNIMLTGVDKEIDYIIPVPLHKKRYKERGYNQSYLLSKQIAKDINVSVNTNILFRIKNTPKQSKLNREKRLKNLDNAFMVKNKEALLNKNILLIDDVFTTGSTINECSRILKESGSKKVFVAIITAGNISGE